MTRVRSGTVVDAFSCRLRVALAAMGSIVIGCGDLVEDVSATICPSGKRWVGGQLGSEEMRPGDDCVGCHRDNAGPPLLIGGTVYASRESDTNCFGLPGVEVSVATADGRVFEMTTNRAGNFFVFGPETDLEVPLAQLRTSVSYTLPDGRAIVRTMVNRPSYGGCSGCHSSEAVRDVERGIVPTDRVDLGLPPEFYGELAN